MLVHWIWYALAQSLDIGQKLALLEHFPDPEDIYYADSQALCCVETVTPQAARALQAEDIAQAEAIYRRCQEKQIGILTFQDTAYPQKLKNIYDPPLVLYCIGQMPSWEEAPVLAVAGTRKASPYGLKTARRMAGELTMGGGLVLTGGSAGIEAMAIEGALAASGATAVLLPCGVDAVYPRENRRLFEQVRQKGCLLSEYPPGTAVYKWNFRRRNRILAGIASGVLLVEAPEGSGSLRIPGAALEYGRDVFVVPANVDAVTAAGSNAFLRENVMAVLSGWDVLQEYESLYPGRLTVRLPETLWPRAAVAAQEPQIPKTAPASSEKTDRNPIDNGRNSRYSDFENLPPDAQTVLAVLSDSPKMVDEIAADTGLPAGKILSTLTLLTMKGLVCNHPGKRVSIYR